MGQSLSLLSSTITPQNRHAVLSLAVERRHGERVLRCQGVKRDVYSTASFGQVGTLMYNRRDHIMTSAITPGPSKHSMMLR